MYKFKSVYFFKDSSKVSAVGTQVTVKWRVSIGRYGSALTVIPKTKEKAAAEQIENILVHACDNIPMLNTNAQAIECLIRI